MAISLIETGPSAMSAGPAVRNYLYDAVLGPPLVVWGRSNPSFIDLRGIRTAVDVHMDRIFPGRVEILRVSDGGRQPVSVHLDVHQLREGVSGCIIIRTLHIRHLECRRCRPVTVPDSLAGAGADEFAGFPGLGCRSGLISPDLGRSSVVGEICDEIFPVRRELHGGNIHRSIGQGSHDSLVVNLVESLAHP